MVAADATIGEALRQGARSLPDQATAMLDARLFLKSVLRMKDSDLIANANNRLEHTNRALFEDMLDRRRSGEPSAYIIGQKEFWSLSFRVSSDVLIPRPDTESLIEAVLARRRTTEALSILDLGTGTGCITCALLSEFPNAHCVSVDISQKAIDLACENTNALGLGDRAVFVVSDWGRALAGPFDVIVSNPPYIALRDRDVLPRDVAEFEPGLALFAGADGFRDYRLILDQAPALLASDGLMVLEAGDQQSEALTKMAAERFPDALITHQRDLKGFVRAIAIDLRSPEQK